ncbi:hypothetical protein Tco_1400384 [Tanacetum coccineum]
MEDVRYQLNTSLLQERRTGFAAALAVLITGASQSRQHDTLVRLPMDIRLKIDLENQSHEVISVFSPSNELFQIPHQSPLKQPLIDRLDHDAGPFSVQVTSSPFWQIFYPQVVRNIMKHISDRYDTLRVLVCSVWGHFGDVISESLKLGNIKFLLVAFDSRLKVFYPFKNYNTSGEHPQCCIQVTDMSKMNKNKAKLDKTKHEIGRVQEIKAEGVYIFK